MINFVAGANTVYEGISRQARHLFPTYQHSQMLSLARARAGLLWYIAHDVKDRPVGSETCQVQLLAVY